VPAQYSGNFNGHQLLASYRYTFQSFLAFLVLLEQLSCDNSLNQKTRPENKKICLLEQTSSAPSHINDNFAKYSTLIKESIRSGQRNPREKAGI